MNLNQSITSKKMKLNFVLIFLLLFSFILLNCDGELSNYDRAKKFMALKDWDNAIKALEQAVWDKPDAADIRFDLGRALDLNEKSHDAKKQYTIAAEIGGSDIAKRFMSIRKEAPESEWGSNFSPTQIWSYALMADPENAAAHFSLGMSAIASHEGLFHLRQAFDNGFDDKILLEACFSELKKYGRNFGLAFTTPILTTPDDFEDFGPAIFSLDGKTIIWSRAAKNSYGRFSESAVQLHRLKIGQTESKMWLTVKSRFGFPCLTTDSTLYFSDGMNIFSFQPEDTAAQKIIPGAFPDVSSDKKSLLSVNRNKIYLTTLDSLKTQEIKLPGYINFNPQFDPTNAQRFYFLSSRDDGLKLCHAMLDGSLEKIIYTISRYGVAWDRYFQNNFDISPDGKSLVCSDNENLYCINLETLTADTLWVYGGYPKFSPDGKKLAIFLREYGPTGKVAIVDLEKYHELKNDITSPKPDRKKILKHLTAATRAMTMNKVGQPEYAGKW